MGLESYGRHEGYAMEDQMQRRLAGDPRLCQPSPYSEGVRRARHRGEQKVTMKRIEGVAWRVGLGTLLLVGMAGCTVTYPLVGAFADYNAVFRGTVQHHLPGGGATIQVTGVNWPIRCQGEAIPTSRRAGTAELLCDDGTAVQVTWTGTSLTTGSGAGHDQEGRQVRLAYGMTEEEAAGQVEQALRQSADRPLLPAASARAPRRHVEPEEMDLPLPGLETIREAGRPAPRPAPSSAPRVPTTP